MLKITNLHKRFGDLEVLKGIDLEVQEGEVISVIGASGAGKSTLLRCINFLEKPAQGLITIDGISVDSKDRIKEKTKVALRSKTAMVFQSYALFLNKTAIENIMEPMVVVQKIPKPEAHEKALAILEMVGLLDKENSYPSKLSGGQQQRIGIGRAIAVNPKVMLLDEPTSSLDPELVGEVLNVIRKLAMQKMTMIIVTHEMEFARSISDRVLFMNDGRIEEEGTPKYIFSECENENVTRFLHKYYAQY